mmetsp:Transcript_38393/g.90615  ORF Transcript_38393/g.90615 Transcript_38393/m.90615 type:complete len:222 (+) Transcript_38393:567-1232(+)
MEFSSSSCVMMCCRTSERLKYFTDGARSTLAYIPSGTTCRTSRANEKLTLVSAFPSTRRKISSSSYVSTFLFSTATRISPIWIWPQKSAGVPGTTRLTNTRSSPSKRSSSMPTPASSGACGGRICAWTVGAAAATTGIGAARWTGGGGAGAARWTGAGAGGAALRTSRSRMGYCSAEKVPLWPSGATHMALTTELSLRVILRGAGPEPALLDGEGVESSVV